MAEWFTPADLAAAKLPGLPDERAIRIRADAEWRHPAREGTHWRRRTERGGGYEYHIATLPRPAQIKLAMDAAKAPDAGTAVSRSVAWEWFATLPEKKKAEARARSEALDSIDALVRAGLQVVVATMEVARSIDASPSTIYRWREATYGIDRADWLPALAPRHAGRLTTAECPAEAWDVLRADWLRPERPNFSDCYRRLQMMAPGRGWTLPSAATLQRRLEAIPVELRVLAREGLDALKRMYPAQERDRSHLHALESVNIDGHKWDVFVRWPDGTVLRPMMVALQDLYSGMVLAWRIDRSENKEAVRLVFGDMVEAWGIPNACYLDNGRGFASKWITGKATTRYRFKIQDDEPSGLLTQLGVAVHWTTPYSGQSKPIERAFRDMAQSIAKHPRFAGAWCGNTIDAKPENYASHAVPLDEFIAVVGEGIAEHNARPGRRTRVCNGQASFGQAFARSYAQAPIVKATAEQRRLWLLAAEAIRVDKRDGSITLEGNRFWAPELVKFAGQRVTVRFDPQALQDPLHVYRSDGGFIVTAECLHAVGFDNVDAAKVQIRARKAWLKAAQAGLEAERVLGIKQVAAMLPEPPIPAPLPEAKVVRPMLYPVAGNAAMRPVPARQAAEEADDFSWLEQSNAARRAERGLRLVPMEDAGGDD